MIKLGDFVKRNTHLSTMTEEVRKERAVKKAMLCAQKGEIGKAIKCITRKTNLPTPSSGIVQELQEKHPDPNIQSFTDQEILSIKNFKVSPEDKVKIDSDEMFDIIFNRKDQVRPAHDHSRYEFWKSLVAHNSGPFDEKNENVICTLYAEIITRIVNDEAPAWYTTILRDTEIIPLLKENGDLRPIGMNLTTRKHASIAIMNLVSKKPSKEEPNFIDSYLYPLQQSHIKNGTENIALSMGLAFELHPHKDKFAMDGNNAYNNASRMACLLNIKSQFSKILPFVRSMYGEDSRAWYYGLEKGIVDIQVKEGFTQGDVIATFGWAMTIHPFLQQLKEILGDDFVGFFVDDDFLEIFEEISQVLENIESHIPMLIHTDEGFKFANAHRTVPQLDTNNIVESTLLAK
jgi:hypothetical protein